jgi:putative membrane-bound dehydrogenase-like protein
LFRSRRLLASKRCSQPPARPRATSRPIDALKAFDTEPGFAVTLVAAEPLVVDPVALAFDDRGRLFVAENRDYPTGSQDGRPLGVIALLEDTDDDGRMDKRTEFASGIAFPNGVMCWRGGVIVAAAPDAPWLKDADGDGRAEVREVLLTGFALGGPSQLRVNDPTLGPDGWIYFAGGLREESVCGRALFFLLLLCATVTPMRPFERRHHCPPSRTGGSASGEPRPALAPPPSTKSG